MNHLASRPLSRWATDTVCIGWSDVLFFLGHRLLNDLCASFSLINLDICITTGPTRHSSAHKWLEKGNGHSLWDQCSSVLTATAAALFSWRANWYKPTLYTTVSQPIMVGQSHSPINHSTSCWANSWKKENFSNCLLATNAQVFLVKHSATGDGERDNVDRLNMANLGPTGPYFLSERD